MARKPKYKPSYAKKLRDGLRLEPRREAVRGDTVVRFGWTIEWICVEWGISTTTYYNWVNEYTTFAEAHKIGEDHFKAFLQDEYDEAIYNKDCNAQLMKPKAAKYLGYTDKKQIESTSKKEEIRTIEIKRIDSPAQIEHKETNYIDIEVMDDRHPNTIDKPTS